jgi:hypothetical protein
MLNKSNGLKPFGTYNLLLDGKAFDLKAYGIDSFTMGHIYPGTYIDFKNVTVKESTAYGVSSFKYQDVDYNPKKHYDSCDHYKMSWQSYNPDCFKITCLKLIDIFKGYKGSKVFVNDGGPYANLVEEYILDDDRLCYVRREFYAQDKSTTLTAEEDSISKAIDKIVKKLEKYSTL